MLVANSWRTRQDLVHHFGRSPETIAVVYLGIDGTQFGPLAPEQRLQRRQGLGWHNPTLLFIGNPADPRKGFATVLSAWAEVCGDPDWDAHLVVVGGGAALKGDRLRGLGFRDDVPHLLPAADGLVSPTRYESYGMGVHEAICCGVPAIVSRDAGVAERYPEGLQDLLLRDPRSGAELATVLRQWRRHLPEYPNRVADFGEQLRQRSWDRMAAEIVSLWF
jgi:glycosyltransferase involved in cell wall biosynthesis